MQKFIDKYKYYLIQMAAVILLFEAFGYWMLQSGYGATPDGIRNTNSPLYLILSFGWVAVTWLAFLAAGLKKFKGVLHGYYILVLVCLISVFLFPFYHRLPVMSFFFVFQLFIYIAPLSGVMLLFPNPFAVVAIYTGLNIFLFGYGFRRAVRIEKNRENTGRGDSDAM